MHKRDGVLIVATTPGCEVDDRVKALLEASKGDDQAVEIYSVTDGVGILDPITGEITYAGEDDPVDIIVFGEEAND